MDEKVTETPRNVPACLSRSRIPFTYSKEETKADISTCACQVQKEVVLSCLPLFKLRTVTDQKVTTLWCAGCQTYINYDGFNDQVLNMGSYLIGHDVMRQYMKQFLTEGFRYAWYAWIDLLDINYSEGYACPDCGDRPEMVIMDGVTLGIRKVFLPWDKLEKREKAEKIYDGSYHPSRVFINNQKTRNLLLKYAQKGISRTEFQTLRQLLSLYQTSMDPLMTALEETGFNNKAPDYIAPFIKYLACNYPVCGWLHYDAYLFDILTSISEGTNIDEQEFVHLNEVTPILASMVRRMDTNILRPILLELIRKTKVPFSRGNPHDLPMTEKEDVCGYFPTLPKFCDRGSYVLDDKKSKLQDGKCEKKTGRHPSLTPGIFTLSCKHGVCYGFHLMEDVESPNVPYTILRTRFSEVPKVVMYDNACNLGNYALNRDPVFFKYTWFLVDRFHWCSHTFLQCFYTLK